MKRQSFEAGELIFQEGDSSAAAFFILSGTVEIVRRRGDGNSKTLAVLGKGNYFGEMGVTDDHQRSASKVAKQPVVSMSIERAEFMDMLLNHPGESIELLTVLFDRIRIANHKLMQIDEVQAP